MSIAINCYAQQETQQSMYFFNPSLFNPAYTGSQEALQITGLARNQWIGLKGAPKTQCFTMHSPLRYNNVGLGLTILNDELGVTKNTGIYADMSYRIKLNKKDHQLAFGLRAGVDLFRQDFSTLRINDQNDQLYIDGFNYRNNLFNIGSGLYYYGSRFYFGISCPRMINNNLYSQNNLAVRSENHVYIFGGFVFKLNAAVNIRPSMIVKYVNNIPISLESNLSFLFFEKFWVGAMYRHKSATGFNFMFNINEYLRAGYAYDYQLTELQKFSNGSHELVISYTLKSKSKSFKSPRYF